MTFASTKVYLSHIHQLAIPVNAAGTEKTLAKNSPAAQGIHRDVHCPRDLSHLPKGQPREKPTLARNSKPRVCGHPNRKKYTHHPAFTDSHWPSDLFSSIKFTEKQSLPQTEALISHLPQTPLYFDLGNHQASPTLVLWTLQ